MSFGHDEAGAYEPGLLDDGAAGYGNLGSAQEIAPGRPQTLVQLSGDDWTARQVTVCLVGPDLVQTGPRAGALPAPGMRAVAIASWGIGGLRASAEIDFLRGTTFSVPAASLQVVAHHELVGTDGPPLRVGAFVGYSPRPGGVAPQRTIYGETTEEEPTLRIDVPTFASSVRVFRVRGPVALTVAMVDFAGERLAEVNYAAAENTTPVPLLNGAVALEVMSERPSPFAFVFGLSL